MNPLINLLDQNNPMISMFQPLYNALRGSTNPMQTLGQMAYNDQRMQQVVNTINQYGGIQQAVYGEAQKRNLDPNSALQQAQQMMQTFNRK